MTDSTPTSEQWTRTNELRWLWRPVLSAQLQQRWVSSGGREEWRAVETVYEEEQA